MLVIINHLVMFLIQDTMIKTIWNISGWVNKGKKGNMNIVEQWDSNVDSDYLESYVKIYE